MRTVHAPGRAVHHALSARGLRTLQSRRSRAAAGPVEQFDGVHDRRCGAGSQLHDAAHIAGRNDVGAAAPDIFKLAIAQLRGKLRLQDVVSCPQTRSTDAPRGSRAARTPPRAAAVAALHPASGHAASSRVSDRRPAAVRAHDLHGQGRLASTSVMSRVSALKRAASAASPRMVAEHEAIVLQLCPAARTRSPRSRPTRLRHWRRAGSATAAAAKSSACWRRPRWCVKAPQHPAIGTTCQPIRVSSRCVAVCVSGVSTPCAQPRIRATRPRGRGPVCGTGRATADGVTGATAHAASPAAALVTAASDARPAEPRPQAVAPGAGAPGKAEPRRACRAPTVHASGRR